MTRAVPRHRRIVDRDSNPSVSALEPKARRIDVEA